MVRHAGVDTSSIAVADTCQGARTARDAAQPRPSLHMMLTVRLGMSRVEPRATRSLALAGWMTEVEPVYLSSLRLPPRGTDRRAHKRTRAREHRQCQLLTARAVRGSYPHAPEMVRARDLFAVEVRANPNTGQIWGKGQPRSSVHHVDPIHLDDARGRVRSSWSHPDATPHITPNACLKNSCLRTILSNADMRIRRLASAIFGIAWYQYTPWL